MIDTIIITSIGISIMVAATLLVAFLPLLLLFTYREFKKELKKHDK